MAEMMWPARALVSRVLHRTGKSALRPIGLPKLCPPPLLGLLGSLGHCLATLDGPPDAPITIVGDDPARRERTRTLPFIERGCSRSRAKLRKQKKYGSVSSVPDPLN